MKGRKMWEEDDVRSRRGKSEEKDLMSKYKNKIYDLYTDDEEEDSWFWDNEDTEQELDDR